MEATIILIRCLYLIYLRLFPPRSNPNLFQKVIFVCLFLKSVFQKVPYHLILIIQGATATATATATDHSSLNN